MHCSSQSEVAPERSLGTASSIEPRMCPTRYDFGQTFEYDLDLILDALEKRRDTAVTAAGVGRP